MSTNHSLILDRRSFLHHAGAALSGLAAAPWAGQAAAQAGKGVAVDKGKPTRFQIACMTLPYSAFPLERALTGLKEAGYRYVAWGTAHRGLDGKAAPVIPDDAPPERAKELGQRCRDLGLEPLMLFSGIYPDDAKHLDVLKSRIRQAAAAGVPQVLMFGNTRAEKSDRRRWIEQFK